MEKKRVLVASDIHLCHQNWYGVDCGKRVQKFVDDVISEYEKEPYEILLLLGDYSLDFWAWNICGSYINQGKSYTKDFVDQYVSQIKAKGIPVFMIAGNHEQYGEKKWHELTGDSRKGHAVCGDYLFILEDTFSGNLDPKEHSDGTYTPANMEYITGLMNRYPDKKVILCSHYFYPELETEEFKNLVKNDDRILCLMVGHEHISLVQNLGEEWGGKCMLNTGNYSYSGAEHLSESMWGYREVLLSDDGIESNYITPDNDVVCDEGEIHQHYSKQDRFVLKF